MVDLCAELTIAAQCGNARLVRITESRNGKDVQELFKRLSLRPGTVDELKAFGLGSFMLDFALVSLTSRFDHGRTVVNLLLEGRIRQIPLDFTWPRGTGFLVYTTES